jgi:hypothetical protein
MYTSWESHSLDQIRLSIPNTVTFPASCEHGRATSDSPVPPSKPSSTTHLTINMPRHLPNLKFQPAIYIKIPPTTLFLRAPLRTRRWPRCRPQEAVAAPSLTPRMPRNINLRTQVSQEMNKTPTLLLRALDSLPSQRNLGLESSSSSSSSPRPSNNRAQDRREGGDSDREKAREESDQARRREEEERADKAENRKDTRTLVNNLQCMMMLGGVISCINHVVDRKWPDRFWEFEARRRGGCGGS